jgi:hypothetical protein
MAAKITPSLRASIERLKHAGAVNGLCLGWRRQVLVNLLPFGEFRAERVLHMLIDAREHFVGGGRAVETVWFGYEGIHLLAVFQGDCTLMILHSRASDVDFLAHAGLTFLADGHVLINAALNPSDADGDDTQPIAKHESESNGENGHTNLIPRF